MKKTKIYIVFKTYMTSGLTDIHYVGRSKRLARKCFLTCAEPFLLRNWTDPVKLVFATVYLTKTDYEDLLEEYSVYRGDFDNLLSNLVYDSTWTELGMINEKTFKLDFIPWYCNKERVSSLGLLLDGVLSKLSADPENNFHRCIKKYLNKNF
jgi:hypothetical protein